MFNNKRHVCCAGIGIGLSYAPCIVVLGYFFKRRRAFANGLAVAGSGIGSFLVPPLYRILIDSYSLKWCLVIFGALALHVTVAGALMRPKSFYDKPRVSKIQTLDVIELATILTLQPTETALIETLK